ncbi:UNVERIFIED_CONTAM: putative secreted protein with MSEP-CTERM motif [Acetivibrio alkalicellulosi]
MQKLIKPIYLILFMCIPQVLITLIFATDYIISLEMPSWTMIVVLMAHVAINILVMRYYFKNKNEESLNKKTLNILLISMISIFSVGVVLVYNEKNFNFINLEIIYLLLNSISLLYLTIALSIKTETLNIKNQVALCIVIPILTGIFLGGNAFFFEYANIIYIFAMALFCAFIFLLFRLLFLVKTKKATNGFTGYKMTNKYRIVVSIVAVIMPIIGLTLNNYDTFLTGSSRGILGDFSNVWFYIIAVLNGLLMLIDTDNKKWLLTLFYFKIMGFVYIIYFTIIFMPYIPYGFIGIIFYGLGILIFIPLVVFIIELMQIIDNVKKLKTTFNYSIIIVALLGTLTLPTIMSISFALDKTNLQNALTYIEASSNEMPSVNINRLERPIKHMEGSLFTSRNDHLFYDGDSIPIISKFYQTIALDDKIMSNETVQKLSKIFFAMDVEENDNFFNIPQNQNVDLVNVSTSTEFNEDIGVYETWIDLEIKNNSNIRLSEYKTEFILPDGCFIQDYYLYVGKEKKYGILSDKRAALITYLNIIRTPKDPGIIYYKSDDVIELRVYPFAIDEVRKTGFQVLHSQNDVLNIDGIEIILSAENSIDEPINMQGVSFIPASYKNKLSPIQRTQKYYFLIDASENSPYMEHIRKVKEYMEKHNIDQGKIYAVSYKVSEFDEDNVKCEGGFNLSFAMDLIFKNTVEGEYPIIIAVTDNMYKATIFEKNSLAKMYPESEYYYNLDYDLSLIPYSFRGNIKENRVKSPILSKALNYNGITVADNNKSSTVKHGDIGEYTRNKYYNAFILQQKSMENSDSTIIRDSFRQRLLTKHTAFTVLETKEQEKSLLELQEKFLNDEMYEAPAVMMSEPGLIICIVFVLILLIYKRKKLVNL